MTPTAATANWWTLLSIKIEKLRTFLRNSPAANRWKRKLRNGDFHPCCADQLRESHPLPAGIEHNGESFTIRDWMRGVREDQKNGWLFISSNADTHAPEAGDPMWLSIAIRGLLAMGENRNRRVVFCDELPTLHKLRTGGDPAGSRKFGGCYVFGIQSMPSWKISTVRKRLPRCLTS
ncbi:Coupling protein TraD [Escherichia coli]|uniref:Coupling protein TraD n=1 Tax=Escherichia coli TaxID=562 RepID=A0A3P5HCI4_ECOLX|nr:Coupling protein TraD [Escherichia coli]